MKKIIYIISVVCGSLLLHGCDAWLGVTPYDKISEGDLLADEEGYMQLLNGIYIELNSDMLYGGALSVEMVEVMGGAYTIGTDNTVWGNYSDLSKYEYGTTYWRARLSETWDKAYSLILNCNLLLADIDSKREIFTGDNYRIIKGEAMALRAMLHFDMLRIFGPVYSQNPDAQSIPYYSGVKTLPEELLPASKVAKKILTDLLDASILLDNDPIKTEGVLTDAPTDGSSKFLYYRNLRLNYYAVTALMARASLYFGNVEDAREYAEEVIMAAGSDSFHFVDKLLVTGSAKDPDRVFSSELIFALTHASRSTLFKKYYDPSRMPNYVFRMDKDVFSRIYGTPSAGGSPDDYRRQANWKTTGSNSYFYKYADMADVGSITNTMIPMLRLGEMYLIMAECAETEDERLSYMNELRRNRGVETFASLTETNLQYEYIRELYGEGQLFFMYKRKFAPVIVSVNESNNPQPSEQIFVVPLPDSETQN